MSEYIPVQSTGDGRRKYGGKIPDHKIPVTTTSEGRGLRHRSIALQKTQQRGKVPFVTSRPEQEMHSVSKRMTYLPQTTKIRPAKQINAVRGSVSEIKRMKRTPPKQHHGTFV